MVGAGSCYGVRNYVDESFVKPHNVQVEANAPFAPIFEELAYLYYDPKKFRNEHNVRFYENRPEEALARLIETKQALDKHREILTEKDYLQTLPEDQLNLAIENVQGFVPEWPKGAADWYAYLYGGDSRRPPGTYAKEIKNFFEAAENMRRRVSAKKMTLGDTSWSWILAGLTASSAMIYPLYKVYNFLGRAYIRVATRDRFEEKLRKIETYFGS